MITLHILQFLEENSLGTMNTDLFWEKLPLDTNGVGIFSRGGELKIGRAHARQNFDFYSRGESDLLGADKLEKIWQLLIEQPVCNLPVVPDVSDKQYQSVRFINIGNVENLGLDETDRLVFRVTCDVIYKKEIA